MTKRQRRHRRTILRNIYESHGKRRNHAVTSWNMLSDDVRFGRNPRRTARRLTDILEPRGYEVFDDLTIKRPPTSPFYKPPYYV